jgi:hypothetical protein
LVNKNEEKIINILKIPKHALSLAKNGSLGSEEHKQALKFFYQSAIIPQQNKIAEFLTTQFQRIGELEEDEFLQFDNTNVEVLKDDMIKKADLAERLRTAGWSINEIRTEIWDKQAVEGGDKIEGVQAEPDLAPESDLTEESFDDLETKEFQQKEQRFVERFGEIIISSQKQMESDLDANENNTIKTWLDIFVNWAENSVKIVKRKLKPRSKANEDEKE